jgi:carboxyl-terminal processing protease
MRKSLFVVVATLWLGLLSSAAAEVSQVSLPRNELEQLFSAYESIKAQYVENVDEKKLLTDAIRGMVSSLDPHSTFLNADEMAEMQKAESGQYVGIGLQIEIAHGQINVVGLTEDGPAQAAGIVTGDTIVSIDGVAVSALRISEVTKRMRGEPGSFVTLGLAGKAKSSSWQVRLARIQLHTATVKMRMAGPRLAWIRISEFEGETVADLVAALRNAGAAGEPQGLILDLRNDPGGLITAAVGVATAFLPLDTVLFSARGRMPGVNSEVSASARYYRIPGKPDDLAGLPEWTRRVPMAVLVNGASASSAELVAGALQDHGRARVFGSRTFGKGSIQMVVPLAKDSAIKLTVARYFTPKGREIQSQGITPDVIIAPAVNSSVADGAALRESDLANHLAPVANAGAVSDEDTVAQTAERAPVENANSFGTPKDQAWQAAVAALTPRTRLGTRLEAGLRRAKALFNG